MNRQETKARMSAASLGIAEREFAKRVQTNQHRLRSELKTQGKN